MFLLITYDVNTQDSSGQRRLRKISKVCEDYGRRVQHSVFEIEITPALFNVVKDKLLSIMDKEKDSIRIYYLNGKNPAQHVEHYGINPSYFAHDVIFV